jgi:extradiol dioxygenase family protein
MQAVVPLTAPLQPRLRRYAAPRGAARPRCSAASGYKLERAPAEDARLRAVCAFHLAIPVADLAASRRFYGGVLGFPEGRSAPRWIDFNIYGHQVVCHLVDGYSASTAQNAVDGDPVPVPHFGVALPVPEFEALAQRLRAAGVVFELEPHTRFAGAPGEQCVPA